MGDNLFEGLPPPSANHHQQQDELEEKQSAKASSKNSRETSPVIMPAPVLKSALKRPKPTIESKPTVSVSVSIPEAAPPEKRLRFKTTTDASETQVIEAMQKIASHIKTPSKIAKASKLAIQLIQVGSVKPGTSDQFFAILDAAMSSPTSCTDPSVRAHYHALFSAAQDAAECLDNKQKNQLSVWIIKAVVANDLFTDDSFVLSKTATQIKEAISNLPIATRDEDIEEAATLEHETQITNIDDQKMLDVSLDAPTEETKKDESDPFGLDALIPSTTKKDEKTKGKKEAAAKMRKEEKETKRFLKSQREALINCLEIAARRYKTPWCQTVIDIMAKHAFDNVSRFTSKQRDAIQKLWASIREQQTRRKQGKSVTGKLDVNGFEWLQQKYATEKISIRRAVGGGGDRRAQQWLG
ncbi:hypothetical protein CFOL_v3_10295 [Cephalotus follicularis]|uniref:Uncharacterized protein n=1 Tax=Cephalotus follicularis TaxID=3775 RepID=A0A1Q3BFT8_CEPFO|nr:hypothetical protein CFOL_v3_10295 [Cephalotus follicularis]